MRNADKTIQYKPATPCFNNPAIYRKSRVWFRHCPRRI